MKSAELTISLLLFLDSTHSLAGEHHLVHYAVEIFKKAGLSVARRRGRSLTPLQLFHVLWDSSDAGSCNFLLGFALASSNACPRMLYGRDDSSDKRVERKRLDLQKVAHRKLDELFLCAQGGGASTGGAGARYCTSGEGKNANAEVAAEKARQGFKLAYDLLQVAPLHQKSFPSDLTAEPLPGRFVKLVERGGEIVRGPEPAKREFSRLSLSLARALKLLITTQAQSDLPTTLPSDVATLPLPPPSSAPSSGPSTAPTRLSRSMDTSIG